MTAPRSHGLTYGAGDRLDTKERLRRHDERVARFGCRHECRIEIGGALACFDCGYETPGFQSLGRAS